MAELKDKFKTALETAAIVGTGAAVGVGVGSMALGALGGPFQSIPPSLRVGVLAGVGGGVSRSVYQGVSAGTYSFTLNANTGLAVGALAAFLEYTGTLDGLLPVAPEIGHGFIAGALGGWFV